MKYILIVSTIVCSLSLSAVCKAGLDAEPPIEKFIQAPAGAAEVVEAGNHFGFALFHKLRAQEQNRNVCISPLSVFGALALAYNGAREATARGMARALGLEGISRDLLNKTHAYMINHFAGLNPQVNLYLTGSLWANRGVVFQNDFLLRNRRFYGARARSVDFNDPDTPGLINAWIQKRTGGLISNIVDRVDPEEALILINAVYFNGNWKTKFDKSYTGPAPFYLAGGGIKKHPFMKHLAGSFAYHETKSFQALGLDSGKHRSVSMYFFLPAKGASTDKFLASLNYNTFSRTLKVMSRRKGRVEIPRFKLSYGVKNLNEALKKLGMVRAFTQGANFKDMAGPSNLMINKVLHKTILEVYEEGARAAAATVVRVVKNGDHKSGRPPFLFKANRPFFFAIVEQKTKQILFMGVLHRPVEP